MISNADIKQGTSRLVWKEIRNHFQKADPKLTKIIDKIDPDHTYPIYLLYFPYGMLKGDTENSYIPLKNNDFCMLSDPKIEKTIIKELGYGMHSSPLGLILHNHIEYFLEIDEQVIPFGVRGPGTIFNKQVLLEKRKGRVYTPKHILKATAGSRTSFMLPSISNQNGAIKLSKMLDIDVDTPKRSSEHFEIFKNITRKTNSNWRLNVAYFSEKWIKSMANKPEFVELKSYILDKQTAGDSYNSNSAYYDIFYSKVQKDYNLRTSNPYLTNTATHLIKIALGEHPGYAPCTDNSLMPLREIQEIVQEAFSIKKNPTIMSPTTLIYETDINPVYYSFQHPSTPQFLTKKNEQVTANKEIEITRGILNKMLLAMNNKDSMLSDTVFSDLSKNIEFNYFHNYPPQNSSFIKSSLLLGEQDTRFKIGANGQLSESFNHEGTFLRGCVQIKPKETS